MTKTFAERAPTNRAAHIQQLLVVNERQAARIVSLEKENRALRAANTRLKQGGEE